MANDTVPTREKSRGEVPVVDAAGTSRRSERLTVACTGLAVVSVTLAIATAPSYGLVAQLISNGTFVIVGALIARRRPGNVVGLLAMAHGALMVTLLAMHQIGLRLAESGSLDLAGVVVLVAMVAFPVSAGLQIPLFLAFPDRTRPTTAARWYLAVWVLFTAAYSLVSLFARPSIIIAPEVVLPHPFVDPQVADDLLQVSDQMIFGLVLLILGTMPVLVRRWRRGGGIERRQIGWLGLAFFAYTVVSGVNTALQPSGETGGDMFLLVDAFGIIIPLSLAVAILRHRLYDIDVIVSKSAMFLGLAGAITVVYGVVIAVSIAVIGSPSEGLGVAPPIIATVVLAIIFEPVRSRMHRWADRLVFGERATRHEVLSQTSAALAETTAGGGAGELATLLALGTGAEEAHVWIRDPDGYRAVGSHPADRSTAMMDGLPEPSDVTDRRRIEHGGEPLGAVTIVKPRNDPVSPADAEILDDVAAGAGLLLRRLVLTRQLEQRIDDVRRSRRRLVAAQDAERKRLERDLHDGAQQHVVALNVKLGIARTLAERGGHEALAEIVDGLAADATKSVADLRVVAHGIYPPVLTTDGLDAALRALDAPIPVEVRVTDLDRHDAELEQTLYFAVVEIVDRLSSAGAASARIAVTASDTGSGTTPDDRIACEVSGAILGSEPTLGPISDRLEAMGGSLFVDHREERICVMIQVPLTAAVSV